MSCDNCGNFNCCCPPRRGRRGPTGPTGPTGTPGQFVPNPPPPGVECTNFVGEAAGTGTFTPNGITPGSSGPIVGDGRGASTLGNYTVTFDQEGVILSGTLGVDAELAIEGTNVLTFSDGSTLTTVSSGFASQTSPTELVYADVLTITGGTGQFAGASGSFFVTGTTTAVGPVFTFTETDMGAVCLPVS